MGYLGWAGAAPKPRAGSSDGDATIDRLSELVTWLMLVWFGGQRGMQNWVCDGPDVFSGAANGLGCVILRSMAYGGRAATAPVALLRAMAASRF